MFNEISIADVIGTPDGVVRITSEDSNKGVCVRVEFANGYTASLINHAAAYAVKGESVELAVFWDDEIVNTSITPGGVLGWVSANELRLALATVASWAPRGSELSTGHILEG